MTEPVIGPGLVEVVYSSEGTQWVDQYEFEQGAYVYAKIHKDGRGHVRLPSQVIMYRKAYRIKVVGDRRAAR